jgi:transcriptional regulator with XRE-family HTH domain
MAQTVDEVKGRLERRGRNIKYVRVMIRDWSLRELAEKSGVSQNTISRMERGEGVRGASDLYVRSVAEALGISSDALDSDEWPTPGKRIRVPQAA